MKEARESTDLSQGEMAEALGLGEGGQGTVSTWENDHALPARPRFDAYFKVLKVDLGECLYFPEEVALHKRIEAVLMASTQIEKPEPGLASGTAKPPKPSKKRRRLDRLLTESTLCAACLKKLRDLDPPGSKGEGGEWLS